jgi:hypothetical protein
MEIYKIIIDNGKPYEIEVNGSYELLKVLMNCYEDYKNNDYAYFDIQIFLNDTDIIQSLFIENIIKEVLK